jgi:hypothetical protein
MNGMGVTMVGVCTAASKCKFKRVWLGLRAPRLALRPRFDGKLFNYARLERMDVVKNLRW